MSIENKKEELHMITALNVERPCTVAESIKQSCQEVKLMREGKTPKRNLNDLFSDINKWKNED